MSLVFAVCASVGGTVQGSNSEEKYDLLYIAEVAQLDTSYIFTQLRIYSKCYIIYHLVRMGAKRFFILEIVLSNLNTDQNSLLKNNTLSLTLFYFQHARSGEMQVAVHAKTHLESVYKSIHRLYANDEEGCEMGEASRAY